MFRHPITSIAQNAEDVAAGLRIFRDHVPRSSTRIAACISELFAMSSVLGEINNEGGGNLHFSSSFFQVQDDLALLFPSVQRTMDDAFEMFSRSRSRPRQLLWDDLGYKMDREEGMPLLDRLEMYHRFLRAQANILQQRRSHDQDDLRRRLVILWDAQCISILRAERRNIESSAPTAPRSRITRTGIALVETPTSPLSPTDTSDSWGDYLNPGGRLPPRAPDPPGIPISPTYTFASNSSRTFSSSQISYSSDLIAPRLDHWVQNVFDGENPGTPFHREFQLNTQSSCHATADSQAIDHLQRDGFVQAIEIPFHKDRQARVRLYFRPTDSRSRILFINRDSRGRETYFTTKLVNIKIIRDRSSLRLCRRKSPGNYSEWGKLNFYFYERMVLFYCAFVAMKRQDSQEVSHDDLLDEFELEGPDEYGDECQEFGGVIRHGELKHALRLYRDSTSGVVRLEASALRGPMKDVPLWTAFVTKYAHDPDHVSYEGDSLVSLAKLRPPPYVFLAGYQPPKNADGEYILQFETKADAKEFVETWAGMCRSRQ